MPRIYLIVDVSGSMNEMGKIYLQQNLCRTVAQLQRIDQKYVDFAPCFYQWAQKVSEITIQSDVDIPTLEAAGSSSLGVLSDFLSQKLNDNDSHNVLMLSDGHFQRDDREKFQAWQNKHKQIMISAVAVGADADLWKLKKISTNERVYLAENIASAIDCTIFGSDEKLAAPVSTTQILQSEPAEPDEDWDA